jgi:nucleotide-binding universal stress UspA family protein
MQVDFELNVLYEEGAAFGGGIGDRICELAEELNAAAVVVGAHRKSMLAEFMMGSISNFLVHQCSKPVVVLHAPRQKVLISR